MFRLSGKIHLPKCERWSQLTTPQNLKHRCLSLRPLPSQSRWAVSLTAQARPGSKILPKIIYQEALPKRSSRINRLHQNDRRILTILHNSSNRISNGSRSFWKTQWFLKKMPIKPLWSASTKSTEVLSAPASPRTLVTSRLPCQQALLFRSVRLRQQSHQIVWSQQRKPQLKQNWSSSTII